MGYVFSKIVPQIYPEIPSIFGRCTLFTVWHEQQKHKLAYHIHQGYIEEHAGSDGEDPQGDVVGVLAHGRADEHAYVGHHGGEEVVDDGLLHSHARLQKNCKITYSKDTTCEFYNHRILCTNLGGKKQKAKLRTDIKRYALNNGCFIIKSYLLN